MTNRRNFIKNTAAITAGASLLPLFNSAAVASSKHKKIKLADNAVILFQGDSITDAGRDRNNMEPNNSPAFGNGYVSLVAAQLLFDNPSKNLKIYNKGISGNKVFQLADRWDKDCIELKPNVLSIMVGVNDFWHTLTNGYKGTIQTYKDDFAKLLQRTKNTFPDIQLIIVEPYAVKGVKSVDEKWYPAFEEYQQAAHDIANQFDAYYIPLQQVFDKAQQAMPGKYWTGDGVHPTLAGAKIMSDAWLEAFKS
jgi:lysophospholipase L1-like esterase